MGPRSYAAFERADVVDAKRGRPDTDLSSYASSRGYELRGSELASHFSGLNPVWVDYVFNAMRGELAPGRFGTLAHELYEARVETDGSFTDLKGGFWAKKTRIKKGAGAMFGVFKTPPNEPFAAWAIWLPSTTIKLMVPEAALLPPVIIRNRSRMSRWHPPLGEAAPDYRVQNTDWVTDELRAALDAAIGPALQSLPLAFVEVEIADAAIAIRVNGYRDDPAFLDHLVAVAGTVAEGVAGVARPEWRPAASFEAPLGPPRPESEPPWYPSFHRRIEAAVGALETVAGETGMTLEDPMALHRAWPHLPIPGVSQGVLAGTLPGTSTFARLTWQYQRHPVTHFMRGGALVAARPDAPETPPGGIMLGGPDTPPDMYVAARDGVACCWIRGYTVRRLDSKDLIERATLALRESGLADL